MGSSQHFLAQLDVTPTVELANGTGGALTASHLSQAAHGMPADAQRLVCKFRWVGGTYHGRHIEHDAS